MDEFKNKLHLMINSMAFTAVRTEPWFENTSYIIRFFESMQNVGWLDYFFFYQDNDRVPKKLPALTDLIAFSQKWKGTVYYLLNQKDVPQDDQPIVVAFLPNHNALTFSMRFSFSFLNTHPEFTLKKIISFVCDLHSKFQTDGLLGYGVYLEDLSSPYPRIRPPREHDHFYFGNLVDFFSRKYYQNNEDVDLKEIEKIFNAPVPPEAKRWWCNDDLLVIQWIDNWLDMEEMQKRRTLQEKWLVDLLDPPIHYKFNAEGDEKITDLGTMTVNDTYLTRYKASQKFGYKVTVVMPDGSVDEELFAEMHSWIQTKQLPDGRSLEKLYLIVQSRQGALSIHDRAIGMGIAAVYYLGENNIHWNPFPEGLWAE